MKLLIEIPEELVDKLSHDVGIRTTLCDNDTLIVNAIKNGTPIPDNATNLDVVMAVFPGVTLNKILWVDTNWAKEPYKGGE